MHPFKLEMPPNIDLSMKNSLSYRPDAKSRNMKSQPMPVVLLKMDCMGRCCVADVQSNGLMLGRVVVEVIVVTVVVDVCVVVEVAV